MDNLLARTWPTFVRNVRPIPYVCIHRRNWRDVALLMAVGPTIKRPYRSLYFIFHFFATPYDKKKSSNKYEFHVGGDRLRHSVLPSSVLRLENTVIHAQTAARSRFVSGQRAKRRNFSQKRFGTVCRVENTYCFRCRIKIYVSSAV